MKMKWSDLEPGDVVRFTKEVFNHHKRLGFHYWVAEWCNRDLVITKIDIRFNWIAISITNGYKTETITINLWGSAFCGFENVPSYTILFDVIKVI